MPLTLSEVELVDGIAIYRIAGDSGLTAAVRMVTQAIERAVQARHRCCLIDATQLEGLRPPSVAARYEMVRAWALAAEGRVHCALLVRPELIDHERIGVAAARNFGLSSDVFHVEAEAMAWLRNHV